MSHRGTRGKRGRTDRAANKLRGQNISAVRRADMDRYKDKSTRVTDGGVNLFDQALVSETVETHIIPRQSITKKQALAIFPIAGEVVELRGRQLLKVDGIPQFDVNGNPIMVEVTERKQISRPVDSLLRKGNPFNTGANIGRRSHYDKTFTSDKKVGTFQPTDNPNMAEVSIRLKDLDLPEVEDKHSPKRKS